MLENLLKLKNIKVLEKREQLLCIKGGAHCTDKLDKVHCHAYD